MSDDEAEWLLNVPPAEALAHPTKILEILSGKCLVLLVTGSARGSAFSSLGHEGVVPAFETKVQV